MSLAVQSITDVSASGFSATIATSAQSHSAGNLLVALVFYVQDPSFPSDVSSITNTAGDTWTLANPRLVNGNNFAALYYTPSTAGNASDVVTAHFTGSFGATARLLFVYEVSGADSVSPFDGYNVAFNNSGSSASLSTGTITVTGTDIIIAAATCATGGTLHGETGFTYTKQGGTNNDAGSEYKLNVTSSQAATASLTLSAQWTIMGASFKASSGGGGGGVVGKNEIVLQAVNRASTY